MIYREIQPGPALAPWVRCFWFLRGQPGVKPQPILPDGCVEIVVHLGSPFVELRAGNVGRQPANLVVGQMTRAVTVVPTILLTAIRPHARGDSAAPRVTVKTSRIDNASSA